MGTKSTAVKRWKEYEILHEDGSVTRVEEVTWVDPARPSVARLDRTVLTVSAERREIGLAAIQK